MAFDEDPDKVQKKQINETIEFIQEQERILKKFDKSVEKLYMTMTSYHPPDADLKPYYDRFLGIGAMLKSLVADIKVYNEQNYTDYLEAQNGTF